MTIAYAETLRNAQLAEITAAAGGGALLRIYDGARPATGAAITTQVLLAQLTCGTPFAAAPSGGVLTANAITQDASADATGTASWFRLVTSAAAFVMDGNVGTSGSDLNLSSVSIVAGGTVEVTSFVVTGGNA